VTTGANPNTISADTGTALNVANTTIGSSGLTFRSISAGNSSTGPAKGIVLDTTGSSGGLTVTGNGGTCTEVDKSGCSGGQIQHTTGADDSSTSPVGTGIVLNNTQNVSLTRMWLHDNANYAIRGNSVNGFTLATSVIDGTNGGTTATSAGSPFFDSSVYFTELTGSATVSNTNISGGFANNFWLVNTGGTLNRLTFSSVTIGANDTNEGNDGIGIEAQNTAVVNVTVQNSTFTSARGDLFGFNQLANSGITADLVFTGNALSNNHPAIATGGGGVTIHGGDNGGSLTFDMENNTFRDAVGPGVLIVKATAAGTYSGTFNNNTIGVAAVANSGSSAGSDLKVQNAGQGTVTVAITNNHIYQYNNFGIEVEAGGSATAQSGNLNTTITGNTIADPGNAAGSITIPKNGIQLNIGTVPGDTYQACAKIGGASGSGLANALAGSGADAQPPLGGGQDVRLRQRQATTIRLPGYSGANNDNTAVETFVANNNTANGTPTVIASNTVPTGGGYTGTGSTCP
jgi:hypothetical protein